jgi:mannosyltransferase OCH1-like enzyme
LNSGFINDNKHYARNVCKVFKCDFDLNEPFTINSQELRYVINNYENIVGIDFINLDKKTHIMLTQNKKECLLYNIDTNVYLINHIKMDKPIKNIDIQYNIKLNDTKFIITPQYVNDYTALISIYRSDCDWGWNENLYLHVLVNNKLHYYYVGKSSTNNLCIVINTDEKLELVNLDYIQDIPKKIFQTHEKRNYSVEMENTINSIIEKNPEYEYKFFDNNMCREYIEQNFDEDVLNAYDNLNLGAFKADLFRYCVLYKEGGVYIDCKMILNTPLRNIINEHDSHILVNDKFQQNNAIYNAFMCSIPNNNLFKICIDMIVNNVKKLYYPENPILVTGPLLLRNAFNIFNNTETKFITRFFNHNYIGLDYTDHNNGIFNENNKLIINKCHKRYYRNDRGGSYAEGYKNGMCYKNCNSVIPKIVHYTFMTKNLPEEILQNIENNKKMCPNYEFIFYDDNDVELFIKNNFNYYIYSAYKNINPIYGAMRADFFRYCVLFIKGGVYIDIKSLFLVNIENIIRPNDICILDIPRCYEAWRINNKTYEQWLLIFTSNHPYLKKIIDTMSLYILRNVEPRINGYNNLNTKQKILHITGPDSFTKIINEYTNTNKTLLHRNINYDEIARIEDKKYDYKNMYIMNNKKHYSEYNESLYISKYKNLNMLSFRNICLESLDNIKNIELPDFQEKSIYEAVLIEYRQLDHLEFLIRNTIIKLGEKWSHTIVCGNLNYDFVVKMCNSISPKIKIIKTNYDNLNQSSYSKLLASQYFWDLLNGDKILIYQEDTCIFKTNIDEFIKWDYIGAPWYKHNKDTPNSVGNGGLSLRTRQCMIDVINKVSIENINLNQFTLNHIKENNMSVCPEDVYFSKAMQDYNIGIVADWDSAFNFSTENVNSIDSFGGHQFWNSDMNWDTRVKNIVKLMT